MPGLSELQASFRRYLMSHDPAIVAHVAGAPGVAREQRLAVYANAYRSRLIEALATDYAVLQAVLGEEVFTELCHGYVESHPSTFYSLRWFGRQFPAFLRRQGKDHLAELAVFEWQLAAAFDARNAPVVAPRTADDMSLRDWPAARMRLHPSVRMLVLHWNTLEVWQAAKNRETGNLPRELAEPHACLIWRDGLITRFRSMDIAEYSALEAAASGVTMTALCERLAETGTAHEKVALQAAGFIKTWLAQGMVSELSI